MTENEAETLIWSSNDSDSDVGVAATLIEGAEVVRTAAVSYATPILHKVFIQGSPLIKSPKNIHTNHAKVR